MLSNSVSAILDTIALENRLNAPYYMMIKVMKVKKCEQNPTAYL